MIENKQNFCVRFKPKTLKNKLKYFPSNIINLDEDLPESQDKNLFKAK